DALRDVPVPLVLRHGDFKLENVLGAPDDESTWRILDWELWTPRGLPLLDAWHLIAARRAREADCSMGTVVRRWLLPGQLEPFEKQLIARCAQGLDARYVEVSPILYWLDRIGPIAARGAWPSAGWETANIAPVLEALAAVRPVEVEA